MSHSRIMSVSPFLVWLCQSAWWSAGLLLLQVLRVRQRVPRVCLVGAQPTRLKQAEALGAELAGRDGFCYVGWKCFLRQFTDSMQMPCPATIISNSA